MQGISWDNELQLGIKSIDATHRKMINIANEFIYTATESTNTASLPYLLTRLREIVVPHIGLTESIMATARYKKRARYSLENQHFKLTLKRFQTHLQTTGEATAKELEDFKDSIMDYIKGSNQAIAVCVFLD